MAERILTLNSALAGDDLPPKGFPYRNMVEGTRVMFDFTNIATNDGVDGNVSLSRTFNDLAGGNGASIYAGSGGVRLIQQAGRSGFLSPTAIGTGADDQVSLGVEQRIDGTKAFVAMYWVKQAIDGLSTANLPFARRANSPSTGNTGNMQFAIDAGSTGRNLRGYITGAAGGTEATRLGGTTSASIPNLERGVPHLVAVSWVPGVEVRTFHDGATVGINTTDIPTELQELPTGRIYLGGAGKATFYRFAMEEVAVQATNSLRTAAQAVAAEWEAFNGAFV